MPKLIKQNLEQNLQNRLDNNLSNLNQPTTSNINIDSFRTPTLVETLRPPIEEEKSLFNKIGTGLWEFGSEAGEAFIDTFLFGIPSAVTEWEPAEDVDTLAEKIGQAVGGAAGFLGPFGLGKSILSGSAKAIAGKAAAPKIAKKINTEVADLLKTKGDEIISWDSPIATVVGASPQKAFKNVFIGGVTKKIERFDDAFKTIRDKSDFLENVTGNASKYLKQQTDELGLVLKDGSTLLDDVQEIISRNLLAAKNQPISNMQTLLAAKFGNGVKANLVGHVVEEALLFTMAENMLLTVDALAGDATYEDFKETSKHALVVGGILGGVRLLPGGVKGAFAKGPEKIKRLMSSAPNYTNKLNITTESGRTGIAQQYDYFSSITGNNILSGSDIRTFLSDRALSSVNAARRLRLGTEDVTSTTLESILLNPKSTAAQKEAAAQIMKDGLQYLSSHINREWKVGMLKTWGADLVGSSPRMLIGGVAMSGGPGILLSEDIPIEDKLISFFMGAFITKGGKRLEYRTGENYNRVDAKFRDPKTISSRIIEQEYALNALGSSYGDHASYGELLRKALRDNPESGDYLHNRIRPKESEQVIKLENSESYQTDSQSEIKLINEKSSRSGYESVYEAYVSLGESKDLLSEGNRYKEWNELTKSEKDAFIERMVEENIGDAQGLIEYSTEIKTEAFQDIETELGSIYNEIRPLVKANEGVLREISISEISNPSYELRQAVLQYNSLITILRGSGKYTMDNNSYSLTESEIASFVNNYNNSSTRFDNYMVNTHGLESGLQFADSSLRYSIETNRLNMNIIKASKDLKTIFDTNTNFSSKFKDSKGILIASRIQVKGNKILEEKMNSILEVVSKFSDGYDKLLKDEKGSVKVLDAQEARQVLNILKENDILAFESVENYSVGIPIKAVGNLVSNKYIRNILIKGKKQDGTPFTQQDIETIQMGMDLGIISSNLSFRPITELLLKIDDSKVISDIFQSKDFEAINKVKGADDTETNLLQQMLTSVKNESGNDVAKFNDIFQSTVNMINDIFGAYIKKGDNGILNRSLTETTGGDFLAINQIAQRLNLIKNNEVSQNVKYFLQDMYKSSNKFNENTQKAMTKLLNMMTYSKNPQVLYETAIRYNLYDAARKEWLTEKISETELEARLKDMLDNKTIEFVDTEKSIKEFMDNENFFPKTLVEQNQVKIGEVLNTYPLPLNSKFKSNDYMAETPLKKLEDVYFSEGYKNNYNKFVDDFIQDVKKENKDVDTNEIRMAMKSWYTQLQNSKEVQRIEYNANNSDNTLISSGVINNTPVLDSFMNAVGKDNPLVILSSTGVNKNGFPSSLSQETLRDFKQKAFIGDFTFNNFSKEGNEIGNNLLNRQPLISYRFAGSDIILAVKKNGESLDNIAKRYVEIIDKYASGRKKELLKEVNITEENGVYKWDIGSNFDVAHNRLHQVLNDIIYSDVLGGEVAFDVSFRDAVGKDVLNTVIKRRGLINNTNALRFNEKLIQNNIIQASKVEFKNDTYKQDIIESLKLLRDKKLKQVTVADETILAETGVDVKLSVNKAIKDSYQREIELAETAGNTDVVEILKKEQSNFETMLKERNVSDASTVNGVTVVDNKTYNMLAFLAGETDGNSIAGIKPIMFNLGDGNQLFVNKTALLKINDSKLQKILGNAENQVNFLTFTSASKKMAPGERKTPIVEYQKLLDGKLESNSIVPIGYENVSIISVKKNKKYASIGQNNSVHLLSDSQRNSYYQYYVDKINGFSDIRGFISNLKNASNYEQIIATFKRLAQKRINSKLESDSELFGQDTIMQMLADNNVMPTIKQKMWEDMIKQEYLDKMFNIKVPNGVTGVLSPGRFISDSKLQNTIILENGQHYKFGEIELPESSQYKGFDKQNIAFIKKNIGKADEHINGTSEIGKEIIGESETLGELHKNAENKGYQVMVYFERQPHTKPSSVMTVGLKGFRKGEGDVIVLNDADLKRAAEGDYDIDSGSAWWQAPFDVSEGFVKARGEILDSFPLEIGIDSSFNGLKLKDLNTIEDYKTLEIKAQYMMGTTMNANRVVQKILSGRTRHASKFQDGTDANIVFNFSKKSENRYIAVRGDVKETYQRIADLVQTIIDSGNGYDKSLFRDSDAIIDDIFFGKSGNKEDTGTGLFKLYRLKDGTLEEYAKPNDFTETERSLIKQNIIEPYMQLLKLNNKLYDKGEQRKVTLEDIAIKANAYDSIMSSLEFEARKKLDVDVIDPFGGYGESLKLAGEKTNYGQSLIFDRMIAEMAQIKNLLLNPSKSDSRAVTDVEVDTAVSKYLESEKNLTEFVQSIESNAKKYDIAKNINRKIIRLQSYAKKLNNQEVSQSYINNIYNQIDTLTKTRDLIQKQINVIDLNKNLFQKLLDRHIDTEIQKSKDNGTFNTSKTYEDIVKEATASFKENAFKVDFVRDADLINNLAMTYAFNYRGSKTLESMGITTREISFEFETDISQLKKDYTEYWKNYFDKNNQDVFHPDQIKLNISEKIDNLLEKYPDVEPEFILTKLMTPEVDATSIVKYRDKYFYKPTMTNTESYINMVLTYMNNSPRFSKMQTSQFIKDFGAAYNEIYLKLHGVNTKFGTETLPSEIRDIDSFDFPHVLPSYHTRESFGLFQQFNPNQDIILDNSRLDSYQTFLNVFGTSTVKDLLSDNTYAPKYSIQKNRIEALHGIKNFENAVKQGNLFIYNKNKNSSLELLIKGTEGDVTPIINDSKGNYKDSKDWNEELITNTSKVVCK